MPGLMSEPICDIVLLVWNHLEETKACLEAVRRNTTVPCRLLIVDNGSESPTREWLASVHSSEFLQVELLRNEQNLGSPGGFNRGLRASRATYVCILSNDTQPAKGWLEGMIEVAQSNSRIGIIGPSCNTYGQRPPDGMSVERYASQRFQTERGWSEMNYGEFFCMMITRALMTKIGYIDESYGMAYFDDTDYCRRAQQAGFLCVRAKRPYAYHQEGRSLKDTWSRQHSRREQFDRAAALFAARFGQPKRLAYVIADDSRLHTDGLSQELLTQLREFHRVWLFYHGNGKPPTLPDHEDLIQCPMASPSFLPTVIWRVLVKKKRFHRVVTDRRWVGALLRLLKPIHQGEVSVLT